MCQSHRRTLHIILDLYLYSAELKAFDGVGSFHKASKTLKNAGITEDFLLVLGVRKSIAIEFLFQNLCVMSCYIFLGMVCLSLPLLTFCASVVLC